jgi:hypothetical protein
MTGLDHKVIGQGENPHFDGVRSECAQYAKDYPETVPDLQPRHERVEAKQQFIVDEDGRHDDKGVQRCKGYHRHLCI